MKNLVAVWSITFVSIMIPLTLWSIINIYLLNNCDPKFGCGGGFQVESTVQFLTAFTSSFLVLAAFFVNQNLKYIKIHKYIKISTIIVGILIAIGIKAIVSNMGASVFISLSWFIFPFGVGFVVYLVNGLYIKI